MKNLGYYGRRNICGERVRMARLAKRISQETLAAIHMKSGSTKSETTIARLRCERGLTQAALAKGTGVNIRTIQKFDSGERGIETASLAVALRIADFLGVHPRDLI